MLAETMPKSELKPLLWACGPKPMNKLVRSLFTDLGYEMEHAVM